MKRPFSKENRDPGNPAITGLRIALWLLPSFLISGMLLISEILTNEWFVAVIPILLVLGCFGWLDQIFYCQQKKLDPKKERNRIIRGTFNFALLQVLITPAIAYSFIFGYVIITDFQI
jgi:UDP-N-acetylmuramyl pentapeptide phosphotransferase/UDP-N-acetylglucosamine-1-phosphate transferase